MTVLKFRASFLPLPFILLSLYALHQCSAVIYTDQFVIHVKGGRAVAEALANKHGYTYLGEILDGYHHLQHHKITKRAIKPSVHESIKLSEEPEVTWFKQQTLKKRVKRGSRRIVRIPEVTFSDPHWPDMWYLNRGKELDMNIEGAWKQGITGRGVVVTILDDGLEKDHPDIAQNYDPMASYDVNNHDENPEPRYDHLNSNRHGTRCAGEVAAIANNSVCAVGVAFEASIGGVRMLDGDVTDAVEAQSLSLNPNHIDIYSASWGPDDDGNTVDGPGELATKAFKEGVENGRNGLGSIFVWASGNGGREHDNCNCDGYTNSIWTLSISSATENGLVPWYSEACSSTLATTYSSGSNGERQIVTTDLHHKCTLEHTGTSASAPLAAGICALALEANKKLTWRDLQHIVVRTARPDHLLARDWKVNGVGRNVSHSFGYGLMDATAMVNLARNWVTVPPQQFCNFRAETTDKVIPAKSHVTLTLSVHCEHLHYLEHVQSKITLTTAKRGDINIVLTSPKGTRSKLLATRVMDNSRSGFSSWPFMTVHSWGEDPNGVWHLEVHNDARYYGRAVLKEWSLILYGTAENPDRHVPVTTTPPPTTSTTTSPTVKQDISKTQKLPPSKFHYTPPTNPPPYNPNKNSRPSYVFNNNNALSEEPADMPSNNNKLGPNSKMEETAHGSSAQSVVHDGSESSVSCTQQSSKGLCLDCPRGFHLLNGICYAVCPEDHYQYQSESVRQIFSDRRKREENESTHVHHHNKEVTPNRVDTNVSISSVSVCRPCHYSCQSCRGPGDDECLSCHPDSKWDKGYCYPKAVLDKLDEEYARSQSLTIFVGVLCPVAIFLAILAFSNCILKTCRRDHDTAYASLPVKDAKSNGANRKVGHRRLLNHGADNLESEDDY